MPGGRAGEVGRHVGELEITLGNEVVRRLEQDSGQGTKCCC